MASALVEHIEIANSLDCIVYGPITIITYRLSLLCLNSRVNGSDWISRISMEGKYDYYLRTIYCMADHRGHHWIFGRAYRGASRASRDHRCDHGWFVCHLSYCRLLPFLHRWQPTISGVPLVSTI